MLCIPKRAEDRLDYDVQYDKWLSDGDSVQSGDAVAKIRSADPLAPTDIVVDSVQIYGTVIKVWLSGGTEGASYDITVTATSAQGRVKEEVFTIRIRGC